jgi:FPC/CPF motif-containing protein YcgG
MIYLKSYFSFSSCLKLLLSDKKRWDSSLPCVPLYNDSDFVLVGAGGVACHSDPDFSSGEESHNIYRTTIIYNNDKYIYQLLTRQTKSKRNVPAALNNTLFNGKTYFTIIQPWYLNLMSIFSFQ